MIVRVVPIRMVEEEMRYDQPYFAVEAGRPVQIVLDNADLMPHNLVITAPGALREVAEQGLAVDRIKVGRRWRMFLNPTKYWLPLPPSLRSANID